MRQKLSPISQNSTNLHKQRTQLVIPVFAHRNISGSQFAFRISHFPFPISHFFKSRQAFDAGILNISTDLLVNCEKRHCYSYWHWRDSLCPRSISSVLSNRSRLQSLFQRPRRIRFAEMEARFFVNLGETLYLYL
jgi:hypothetical protein